VLHPRLLPSGASFDAMIGTSSCIAKHYYSTDWRPAFTSKPSVIACAAFARRALLNFKPEFAFVRLRTAVLGLITCSEPSSYSAAIATSTIFTLASSHSSSCRHVLLNYRCPS